MAKVDDLRPPGWDQPPRSSSAQDWIVEGEKGPQLTLGHLMLGVVYFAVLFALIAAMISMGPLPRLFLGIFLGLSHCVLGIWAATKWPRYTFIGWIIFILAFVGLTAWTTGVLALPTIPILVAVIIYLSFRRQSNIQDALLGVISLSADRGMPLAPGVLAFSRQVSGVIRVRTLDLAELLMRGIALPEAIESISKLISRPSALLIRMGSESGNLARGLQEAVQLRSIRLPLMRAIGTQLAYLAWVASSGFFITGFLLYFIMPKFEAIFKDFGMSLPEITILLIRASHVAVDYAFVPFLVGFLFVVLYVASLFRGGDMSIPVFDRLFARRHTILILRSLVLFVEAGQPISTAINSLAHWYPTRWVRKKLLKAAVDVDHGHDWIETLRSTGLLSGSDAGVLFSSQRAGNLAWAIRELALTSERRWSFRLQGIMQLLFIGSMLILGALVFLMAVSYFSPLTTLIMRLS